MHRHGRALLNYCPEEWRVYKCFPPLISLKVDLAKHRAGVTDTRLSRSAVRHLHFLTHIHSAIEHMRFPIRNIFPRRQIWVHCLSVHSFHLLPFCCYVLSVAQLLLFSGDFGITRLHSGTTCILEYFFRAYMFPFVRSTKKRCRSALHRSHMLKTVFVCALAGCISKTSTYHASSLPRGRNFYTV